MSEFYLPDLGEGLQGADIVEWKVKPGDHVEVDQLILVVETAKAIVEIPSPVDAIIDKIYFSEGDNVDVGQVLMQYKSSSLVDSPVSESVSVVGCLQASKPGLNSDDEILLVDEIGDVGIAHRSGAPLDSPPSTRLFAQKLGVADRLSPETYSELDEAKLLQVYLQDRSTSDLPVQRDSILKLKGARKVMAQTMSRSHEQIPSVTLFDDAPISEWASDEDITLRCIRAVIHACKLAPILNSWFDEEAMSIQLFDDVHLGVAVNSDEGLFVPVIRAAQSLQEPRIRSILDKQIVEIRNRSIKPQKLLGATISISNFGSLSGRYATPIIVPPQVAIVGIGKIRQEPVVDDGKIKIGRVMPISLSFDHRAASGAEAAKFMRALVQSLSE